jgi:hypothetical protein
MKKWLTSLFLLLALGGGVLAGTPLHSGKAGNQMKCCKKVREAKQFPQMKMVRLCCAINCSDTAPTPSGASFNFSPSAVIVTDSILKQIAALLAVEQKSAQTAVFSRQSDNLPRKIPPKYIQHHSILI